MKAISLVLGLLMISTQCFGTVLQERSVDTVATKIVPEISELRINFDKKVAVITVNSVYKSGSDEVIESKSEYVGFEGNEFINYLRSLGLTATKISDEAGKIINSR